MIFAAGKNTGTVTELARGTVLPRGHGSLVRKDPQNTSVLAPVTTPELIRETQSILLHFPIKEAAEQQGSTTRAVEAQRNGESAMSLKAAVNLCRANPRARAMFAQLIGIPGQCSDPDFMEGLERVVDYFMTQKQIAEDGPAAACDDAMGDLFDGKH